MYPGLQTRTQYTTPYRNGGPHLYWGTRVGTLTCAPGGSGTLSRANGHSRDRRMTSTSSTVVFGLTKQKRSTVSAPHVVGTTKASPGSSVSQ